MFKNGKILGKFNVVDFSIICAVCIVLLGLFIVKKDIFNPVQKIVSGVKPVQFVVVTRAYDVTTDEELFKPGDKTFITIRNVPYTKLEIVNSVKESVKEMFFNEDRPELPYVMDNRAYPYRYQYVITLKDNGQITKDGIVIGGNKIKIGLPVDLEGFNYRLSGMVTDVKVLEE